MAKEKVSAIVKLGRACAVELSGNELGSSTISTEAEALEAIEAALDAGRNAAQERNELSLGQKKAERPIWKRGVTDAIKLLQTHTFQNEALGGVQVCIAVLRTLPDNPQFGPK